MCMRMQQVCILCYRKERVHRQACGHSVSSDWVKAVSVCAAEERGGCIFSLPFLPPLLHVSPISHPSIFHFYMQLQMWRQWNIKLQKWACIYTLAISKTTQPSALAWPVTHFLTLCLSEFKPFMNTYCRREGAKHSNAFCLFNCYSFFPLFLA